MATRYVNTNSTAGGDGTTNNTSGATRAYATLSEWEAARQADLTATETELCYCDGTAAESVSNWVTIDGWTTDATHYIDIRANTASKAGTAWSTSKYRIVWQAVGNTGAILCNEQYVRFDHLQIEVVTSSLEAANRNCNGLAFDAPAGTGGIDWRVSGCHVRFTGTPAFTMDPTLGACCGIFMQNSTISASPTPNFYAWNNVLSFEAGGTWDDTSGSGGLVGIQAIHRNHNAYFYNNTIRGAWRNGIDGDNDTDRLQYLKNNLISGATQLATRGSHVNTRCNYNATNLSDLGYTAGSNDRVSQTFTFVSSSDHAITSGDAGAKNFGLSDPGSGLFSDDIDGKTRSGSWDIGAFEVAEATQQAIGWF